MNWKTKIENEKVIEVGDLVRDIDGWYCIVTEIIGNQIDQSRDLIHGAWTKDMDKIYTADEEEGEHMLRKDCFLIQKRVNL